MSETSWCFWRFQSPPETNFCAPTGQEGGCGQNSWSGKCVEKSMGNLPKNGGVNPKMLGETPTNPWLFLLKIISTWGCEIPFKETLIFGSKGMGFLDVFSAEKKASKDHELKKNRRFIPQMKPKGPAAMENRPGHECFRASRVSHLESNTRPLSAQQKSHTWRAIRPVQWRNFTMISRLFVP